MKTLATVIAAGMFLMAGSLIPCSAQLALTEETSTKLLADVVSNDDTDGDGWSNWNEFLRGTDYRDFYDGESPCLDTLRFGHYVGVVSNYLVLPFSAQVNGPYGVRTNAPVVFGVPDGKARFLAGTKEKQTLSDHVWVRSDTNGQATAWLFLPVDFSLTNHLTITAGTGTNAVTAHVAGWLNDFSGTGQLVTNTNSLPMPLALEARMRWLNARQMPRCQPQFEMLSFSSGGLDYYDTNLFLLPTAFTNGDLYLTAVNTIADAPYQLLSTNAMSTNGGEWVLGTIFVGASGTNTWTVIPSFNVDPASNGFYKVQQSSNIVWVEFLANAIEPRLSDPGQVGLFRISKNDTDDDVPVHFSLSGTAMMGTDYSNIANVVTVPATPGSVEISVWPIGDSLIEGSESVILTLLQTNSYLISPTNPAATLYISDSSTTVRVFLDGLDEAIEPDGPPGVAAQTAVFFFERTDVRDLYPALTAWYTISGTASNGVDYTTISGTIAFAADQPTNSLVITPLTDGFIEGMETVTVTLVPTNAYLIDANASNASVSIADSSTTVQVVALTNAIEPNAAVTNAGQVGAFRISRTDSRGLGSNLALTVTYQLIGSASNGSDYSLLTNTVSIPAATNSVIILVNPVDDNQFEWDETVMLRLVNTNGAYVVDATFGTATVVILDTVGFNPFERVASLPGPVGIDYHEPTNSLIVSAAYNTNSQNYNFVRIYTNVYQTNSGVVTNTVITNWSAVSGIGNEVKLAIVQASVGGFTNGEMFYSSSSNIAWLSSDGTQSNLNWSILTNAFVTNSIAIRGGLYVDRTGGFSNHLVAVNIGGTANGAWRVAHNGSNGLPTFITNINTAHLEGVITLTNDAAKWGPWAGKLLTGDETVFPPPIYAVATNGSVVTNNSTALIPGGIRTEDFDIIPPNQHLYACDYEANTLVKLSSNYFANFIGDLLITEAGEGLNPPGKLFILHWDATNNSFIARRLLYYRTNNTEGLLEHVTFAPIDLPKQ